MSRKINFFDPAVAFSTLYTALVYAIYYSFFESLPLVFPVMYGFNLGQSGLPFLSILVCLAIAAISYNFYMYQTVEKPFTKHGFSAPESRLVPGLWASCIVPIGLFLFGVYFHLKGPSNICRKIH
jgi:DHA1 family multidrug resistance protein-like MFS transporter